MTAKEKAIKILKETGSVYLVYEEGYHKVVNDRVSLNTAFKIAEIDLAIIDAKKA